MNTDDKGVQKLKKLGGESVEEHRRLFHTYVFSFLPLAFYFLLVISFLCDLL